MRVLLISGRYAPHTGGLETAVRALAQQLRAQGHDVRVLTHRYPRTLPAHDIIDGIPVTRLLMLVPRLRLLARPLHLLAACALLPWALTRLAGHVFRADVVGLHYVGGSSALVLLLHMLRPFPLVASLHGGDVDDLPQHDLWQRWVFRRVVRRARRVTACSGALLAQATRLAPALATHGTVLHNGVNVLAYAQAVPRQHPRPYVAAVGRLQPYKGFDRLVRAVAALPRADFDVLIAGDGPERATLAALIAQRGLQARVHLLGTLAPGAIASLLKGAWVVAMPSVREPFGIVALEAMAAGKPLLATPVGGLPEFAATPDNTLAPPDDTAWAAALDAMLARVPTGYESAVNCAHAAQHDWVHVATRYSALLKAALADDRALSQP